MSIQNHFVWERAATGDAHSLATLSVMCARKSLSEEDLAACVEILEANFQKLSKNSKLNLGELHVKLDDLDRYIEILKLNMNDYDVLSCHRLGKCYEYGTGCEKDLDLARGYYTDAARDGHMIARVRLLKIKLRGAWLPTRLFILIMYVLIFIVPAAIYFSIKNILRNRRIIDWRIKD